MQILAHAAFVAGIVFQWIGLAIVIYIRDIMKNIRLNVFETNSSSTHSISISSSSKGVYDTLPVNKGKIVLSGGEFGWEWGKYNDALTKANYAAVFAVESKNQKLVEMLTDVLKKHTGAKKVEFNFSSEYDDPDGKQWAYIDHQSGPGEGGDGFKAFKSPEVLKEFIFNSESWLFTGNDNEASPINFYDVGDVKYTHVLNLDGLKLCLKAYPSDDELKDLLLQELFRHHRLSHFKYNDYYTMYHGEPFAKFDKGVLCVFKTKNVYENDKYLRTDIVDTKELKFKITPV